MSSIFIPPQKTKRWTGPYLGNYYGTLWRTFNIDLDREEGKVFLSRRLFNVADTTDTSSDTLGSADAFLLSDADCTTRWWGLSTGPARLYKTTRGDTNSDTGMLPTDSWDADALDSSPTDGKDMCIFENDSLGDTSRQQLFVSRSTDIAVLNDTGDRKWTGSWWVGTQGQTALKAGVPHPIEYFPFRRIILVGDGNRIHTISRTSPTANETSTASRLVLPTNLQIEHIFFTSTRAWICCSNRFAGNGAIVEWDGFSETYNDIHDAHGKVATTGVNIDEVPLALNEKGQILEYNGRGFFPMVRNGQIVAFPVSAEIGLYLSQIKPRGIVRGNDGLVYMNIRQVSSPNSERMVSGIWCLNPKTGRLYNKHSIGQWANTEFGQQRTGDNGALANIPTSYLDRTLIVGGAYLSDATTNKYAIWTLDTTTGTTASRGYFVTQYIPAQDIRELWDTLWVRFRRFITASNSIVVKARGVRPMVAAGGVPLQTTITWVNATSFTVTLAAGDDPLSVGDEVEVMGGDNAGTLSHITVISGAHAALQTITIDETLTASTNTAIARFDRWKKVGTITSSTAYEAAVNVGIDSSFIQYKVEMRGPTNEMAIETLVANSKPQVYTQK